MTKNNAILHFLSLGIRWSHIAALLETSHDTVRRIANQSNYTPHPPGRPKKQEIPTSELVRVLLAVGVPPSKIAGRLGRHLTTVMYHVRNITKQKEKNPEETSKEAYAEAYAILGLTPEESREPNPEKSNLIFPSGKSSPLTTSERARIAGMVRAAQRWGLPKGKQITSLIFSRMRVHSNLPTLLESPQIVDNEGKPKPFYVVCRLPTKDEPMVLIQFPTGKAISSCMEVRANQPATVI